MHRFLTLLQKDLRYFLYLEGLLMLFRVAFLLLFRSQLNAVSASEILYALYLGFRIRHGNLSAFLLYFKRK